MAEGSGGHWVGVTHEGALLCLLQGNRSLAMPPDQCAAARAVLTSVPRVCAVWYAVLLGQGGPQLHPQHQYPHAGEGATRELMRAWRQRRRVQVLFHTP